VCLLSGTDCLHSVSVCSVRFSQQTATISVTTLYSWYTGAWQRTAIRNNSLQLVCLHGNARSVTTSLLFVNSILFKDEGASSEVSDVVPYVTLSYCPESKILPFSGLLFVRRWERDTQLLSPKREAVPHGRTGQRGIVLVLRGCMPHASTGFQIRVSA
jgi:hypothetical protein